jgi:hypothetical protein
VTYQHCFAGDSDWDNVSLFTFQPLVLYNLLEGFWLPSTAVWNFDWNNGPTSSRRLWLRLLMRKGKITLDSPCLRCWDKILDLRCQPVH